VGIRSVAEAAGVSVTTVSHALNDAPGARVGPETRERIRAVAAELGYTPNTLAQGLRTQRSYTLGFVGDRIATTPHAGRLIEGAQDAAAKEGWVLLLLNSGGDPELERREIQTLLQRQIDGLIYGSMYHRAVEPPPLVGHVPTVLLDASSDDGAYASVVPDEVGGGRAAIEELLRHGHRRIGFINNVDDIPATHGRLEGYRSALDTAGLPFDAALVVSGTGNQLGGYAGASALLDRDDRPSALFCFNDRMAMGAYQAAATLGLRVPHDVSVIGFDDQEGISEGLRPGLTTMALPHYAMGVWAVEALLAQIRDSSVPVEQVRLACPLVVRESVNSPLTR
jgi:LacI family transcriptional regulator